MKNPLSRSEQKTQTRQRILDAAGRGFRKGGFGGIGVDGLAKEAGVTSGAFYVHFDSKAAAFRETVAKGMSDLKDGILHFQSTHGKTWWSEFVRFYLGTKRTCELAESCALQSLPPEVARSDSASRAAFETQLLEMATIIASGPSSDGSPSTVDAALIAMTTLVGAVTFARAVDEPATSKRIALAAEQMLLPTQITKAKTSKTSQR